MVASHSIGLALNPRFRVYLAVVACATVTAIAAGAWMEYLGLNAGVAGDVKRAAALTIAGMATTAAGLLAILSAWRFCRRESDVIHRFESHPNVPWKWKPDWESGRIVAGQSFPLTITAVAALWIALTTAVGLLTGDQWVQMDAEMRWMLPVATIVGLVLAGLAVQALATWKRFGASALQLESSPVVPGTGMGAVVETGISSKYADSTFRVSVTCRREIVPDVRHSRSRREITVWRDVADFSGMESRANPGFLAVPFSFSMPTDVPESSVRNTADGIVWEVSVVAKDRSIAGYKATFCIPVFHAAEDDVDQTSPVSAVYRPERIAVANPGTVVSPGIEVTSTNGKLNVLLRRGREKRLAAILVQFAVLWAAATAVVGRQEIHLVVPLLLGAFTIIPLTEAFRLIAIERKLIADRNWITLQRNLGRIQRTRQITAASVEEIIVTAVADIGMRERYRLAARMTSGETVSLAERIPDQVSARWIGMEIGRAIGIRGSVSFRGDVHAAPARGPIRRNPARSQTATGEAA